MSSPVLGRGGISPAQKSDRQLLIISLRQLPHALVLFGSPKKKRPWFKTTDAEWKYVDFL